MVKALRGRTSRGRGIAAAVALIAAVAALAASASTAGAGVAMRALPGETLHLAGARNLGPVSPSKQITVAITVKHDLNALYRAEWAMYNRSSPSYHHFLTVAGFRREYGTPASVVNAIRSFGTAHGLKLFNPDTLYDYVELSGTAQQVERTFSVQLNRYSEHGVEFYANAQNPLVPAGLPIDAVLGLESLSRYQPADLHRTVVRAVSPTAPARLTAAQRAWVNGKAVAGPRTPQSTGPVQQGNCQADPTASQSLCTGLLSPQELWKAMTPRVPA